MSLRTGTTLITMTLLINKVSGLYGILALATGLPLSTLQLSMYLYSIAALVLTAVLAPHIRKQSPLQCLALAWFYVLDSVINAAYTVAFGAAWFLVLAGHGSSGAAGTIGEHAGFTSPEFPGVASVDIVADTTIPGSTNPDARLIGHTGAASTAPASTAATILQSGSIASITVISLLWAIRLYFILIVLSYARGVLRQYIVHASHAASQPLASTSSDGGLYAEDPFAEGKELGAGWRGRLGRWMVGVGKGYWLGADEVGDVELTRGFARVGSGKLAEEGKPPTLERERRRRAGTGPPLLRPIELENLRKA